MGCKVTVLCFCLVFATVQAIEVNITNAWKPYIGWEINCSWALPPDDSLQAVGLYRDNQQLMYYRPEVDGSSSHRVSRRVENMTSTNCTVPTDDRQKGTCVVTLELYEPLWRDFTIFCDVTGGERPFLSIKRKKFFVDGFVPPSDAVITVEPVNEESGPVTLNCSTSHPRPAYLSWSIGDQQKPRELTGKSWNATSKLWHAWSVISYAPSRGTPAVCTPEVNRGGKLLVKGHAAQYNEARNLKATDRPIEVNITNAWKPYIGWEINCSWAIPPDDSLQSVRLYKDYEQFMIYRPEVDGGSSHNVSSREHMMSTNCAMSTEDRQKGTCVITLELYRPLLLPFTISCEVSREKPNFRMDWKNFLVDGFGIPPSDAVITVGPVNEESGQVTLNCSASCVTILDLSWTIGDQKKPREFPRISWNATSKLWHAWSVISYTPSGGSAAVCTPEISRGSEVLVKGHAAQYNAARNLEATVRAIEVNITNAWKPNIGWEINCSWAIPPDDSLLSVRLYRDHRQFMFYRPEVDGSSSHTESRDIEEMMSTNCAVPTDDRQKGTCVVTLELYGLPLAFPFTLTCEVSGEGPNFRKGSKNFLVGGLVPPSDAVITVGPVNEESGQVTLNCSASCIVTIPHLSWTIGGQQQIPREFSRGYWNATSKLWHAWSVISYTPSSGSAAVCTPEISGRGEVAKGQAAQYNEARNLKATDRLIEVNITNAWKPYIGWEINCSWALPPDDSLLSVGLYRDNEQLMYYRPEVDGSSSHTYTRYEEEKISTNCAVLTDDRQKGTCVITLELYGLPLAFPFTLTCEVSGERPYFRNESKKFLVGGIVPPSDAVITVGPVNEESGQVTLNCSATCVPTIPDLSWTIGDQKIPCEISDAHWNATSKLWHVWSVISYTPSSGSPAVCTPEISRRGELLVKGRAAQYNAARNLEGGVFNTIITVLNTPVITDMIKTGVKGEYLNKTNE